MAQPGPVLWWLPGPSPLPVESLLEGMGVGNTKPEAWGSELLSG